MVVVLCFALILALHLRMLDLLPSKLLKILLRTVELFLSFFDESRTK